tara:strand:+ start:207 stop:401 length:195 start_codon:yes stop_codon:yes gene_type:complete
MHQEYSLSPVLKVAPTAAFAEFSHDIAVNSAADKMPAPILPAFQKQLQPNIPLVPMSSVASRPA